MRPATTQSSATNVKEFWPKFLNLFVFHGLLITYKTDMLHFKRCFAICIKQRVKSVIIHICFNSRILVKIACYRTSNCAVYSGLGSNANAFENVTFVFKCSVISCFALASKHMYLNQKHLHLIKNTFAID